MGLRGLQMISLTRSCFRFREDAACITNAVSEPRPVPAIAMIFSPLARRPASVAIRTISKHTFVPWLKHRRRRRRCGYCCLSRQWIFAKGLTDWRRSAVMFWERTPFRAVSLCFGTIRLRQLRLSCMTNVEQVCKSHSDKVSPSQQFV